MIKGPSVLFVPYKVDRLSESLSPLKLKEYLATGPPIISTPMAASKEFKDMLTLAETQEQWIAALDHNISLKRTVNRTERVNRLAGESWGAKASELVIICQF